LPIEIVRLLLRQQFRLHYLQLLLIQSLWDYVGKAKFCHWRLQQFADDIYFLVFPLFTDRVGFTRNCITNICALVSHLVEDFFRHTNNGSTQNISEHNRIYTGGSSRFRS
jgi:hypothetical protein